MANSIADDCDHGVLNKVGNSFYFVGNLQENRAGYDKLHIHPHPPILPKPTAFGAQAKPSSNTDSHSDDSNDFPCDQANRADDVS